MRVHVPDPSSVLEAVAGRVDAIDARLEVLDRDVTALGRALGGINAALRDLTEARAIPDAADAGEEVPPRSWPDVGDPDLARAWLADVHDWVTTTWHDIAGTTLAGCWPWHSRAVNELLALQAARGLAYTLGPLHVVDFEHRHLLDGSEVLDRVLRACHRAGTHVDAAGARYHTDPGALPALAGWWATSRAGAPPGLIREAA